MIHKIFYLFCLYAYRRCGEPLNKKSSKTVDDDEPAPESPPASPKTVSRLKEFRVCPVTLVADYEKARKNKGSFYIDHPGDPDPPNPLSFAEGGWDFGGPNGPVARAKYLPTDPRTGRP
jgi:hypothetical protein